MYSTYCAKIQVELHTKVRSKQEESGLTLNQYMEQILTQYYEMKEGNDMSEKPRTLALQISEDLFLRVKAHLKSKGIKQKDFIIGIIEAALAEAEVGEESHVEAKTHEPLETEPTREEPTADEQTDQ